MPKKNFIPQDLKIWIEMRKLYHLSNAQIQMARELGMNPRKLGKLNNHKQEPWKKPLPEFIARCYFKRFHRGEPEVVMSIEEKARVLQAKKEAKKAAKKLRREQQALEAEDKPNEPPRMTTCEVVQDLDDEVPF